MSWQGGGGNRLVRAQPHRKSIQAPRRQGLTRIEHEVVVMPTARRV